MQLTATIDRIWQITKSIEQAAAVADWEKAGELAGERSPLLMALRGPLPPDAMARLEQIRAIDKLIVDAARAAQHALNTEYNATLQAARNARQFEQVASR